MPRFWSLNTIFFPKSDQGLEKRGWLEVEVGNVLDDPETFLSGASRIVSKKRRSQLQSVPTVQR